MKQEIIYKDLCFILTGILFSVHNELGRYCNEKQYGDCFEQKLKERNIKYDREKIIPVSFKEEHFGRNRVDFIIEDKIVIEFKCKRMIERIDYFQTQRYLHAYNKKLGLIVNFQEKYIKPRRVLNSEIKIIN